MLRTQLDRFEHQRHDVGLRNGLAFADRQRARMDRRLQRNSTREALQRPAP
jgi:hypothetical protein